MFRTNHSNVDVLLSHNQCPAQLSTPERPCVFDETAFREALDEYAVAEFRFGR